MNEGLFGGPLSFYSAPLEGDALVAESDLAADVPVDRDCQGHRDLRGATLEEDLHRRAEIGIDAVLSQGLEANG